LQPFNLAEFDVEKIGDIPCTDGSSTERINDGHCVTVTNVSSFGPIKVGSSLFGSLSFTTSGEDCGIFGLKVSVPAPVRIPGRLLERYEA
jgi:hypothetical protein